jgi:hypothetical protein
MNRYSILLKKIPPPPPPTPPSPPVGISGLTGVQRITGLGYPPIIPGLGYTGVQGITGLGYTGIQGITGFGYTGIQGDTDIQGDGTQGITESTDVYSVATQQMWRNWVPENTRHTHTLNESINISSDFTLSRSDYVNNDVQHTMVLVDSARTDPQNSFQEFKNKWFNIKSHKSFFITLKEKSQVTFKKLSKNKFYLPTQWWVSEDGENWKKTTWWRVFTRRHKKAKIVRIGLR